MKSPYSMKIPLELNKMPDKISQLATSLVRHPSLLAIFQLFRTNLLEPAQTTATFHQQR